MNYKYCGYCGGTLREDKGQFRCVSCDEAMTYGDMISNGVTFGQIGTLINILKVIAVSAIKMADLKGPTQESQISPESRQEAPQSKGAGSGKADTESRPQSAARSIDARKKGS